MKLNGRIADPERKHRALDVDALGKQANGSMGSTGVVVCARGGLFLIRAVLFAGQ